MNFFHPPPPAVRRINSSVPENPKVCLTPGSCEPDAGAEETKTPPSFHAPTMGRAQAPDSLAGAIIAEESASPRSTGAAGPAAPVFLPDDPCGSTRAEAHFSGGVGPQRGQSSNFKPSSPEAMKHMIPAVPCQFPAGGDDCPTIQSSASVSCQLVKLVSLDHKSLSEAERRKTCVETFNRLIAPPENLSKAAAARIVGEDYTSLWRWRRDFKAKGFDGLLPASKNSGRKAPFLPNAAELAAVREIYTQLDESRARGRGRGSSRVAAYRLAARSDDPRVREAFKIFVLRRKRKNLPKSWTRLLQTTAAVIDRGRDAGSTLAQYISTPRSRTWVDAAGRERPLRAGVLSQSDDGTLNFYAHIPWPFGGDPCSDKFGVKLGRWQLLPVVDVESEMAVVWHVIARNAGSYRGEDCAAVLGESFFLGGRPEAVQLERGSWESNIVQDALKLVHVPVSRAWHSKQKNVVERFFDRLWTPASLIPGHCGRDRGRIEHVTQLAVACQDGRRDPANYFLSLEDAITRLNRAIEFTNTEPVESASGWGRWIPQERYARQLEAEPRPKVDDSLRIFFSREQRVWTVRRATLGGSVAGPLVKFPVYFQFPELWEFEQCQAKCYFDPYAAEVRGTFVLQHEWRGYKPGHVIARDVPALELPPQVVLAEDGWDDGGRREKTLAVRRAISKAVRAEYCDWRGKRVLAHGHNHQDTKTPRLRQSENLPSENLGPSVGETRLDRLRREGRQARELLQISGT